MAVKYFETGFITLNGKMLMKLTDISLSVDVDTDEVHSFDSDYFKEYEYGYGGWKASANGILTDDSAELTKFSGETGITGVTNGFDALEAVKSRTKYNLVIKIDSSNYQKGTVLLTSCPISGAMGTKMTYSLEMQGSGLLTKYSS